MKWLITGGCGFVGSNLANSLMQDGEEVAVLDSLYRKGATRNLEWLKSCFGENFHFFHNDIRDADALMHVIKESRPDVVVHLAGQVAMTTSLSNPRFDLEVNAVGTFNILEAVRLCSSNTIVLYSSTNKVYGSLDQIRVEELETRYVLPDYPLGLSENVPLDGYSPYGCSKLAAEQYVRDYYRTYEIPTVVFRHSSMYGGRQFATYDQGWIGWFCQKSLEAAEPDSDPVSINGNGKQVRDVLHVSDVISIYRLAVGNINSIAGRVYNIGGGVENSLSLLELFALLERINGYPVRYYQLEWRLGDQKVFIADITHAHQDLDWWPTVDKETGIRHMLNWCLEASFDG